MRDSGLPAVLTQWRYVRRRTSLVATAWRLRHLGSIRPAPRWAMLRPAFAAARWSLFFVFCPDGIATTEQVETVRLLCGLDRPLCIVCASAEPAAVPDIFREAADALIWKATDGWDFSAYAIGLWALATASPGAGVFVMNDSVVGPFGDIRPMIDDPPWALAGFTASALVEDHIQTYAFHLADVTPTRLRALSPAVLRRASFSTFTGVVACQETRLARVASRTMSVGAFWYDRDDPAITAPFALADAGFPFVKKSLYGKFADRYDPVAVAALLARQRGR